MITLLLYRNFFGKLYMTVYTLSLLDLKKRLFLCKFVVVQYGVDLPGAFKRYFHLFADHLVCTEVVQAYEAPSFS